MSGRIRQDRSIKIMSTKTGDPSQLSPTQGTPTPGTTTAGNTLDAFESRVSDTYWRLMRVFEHEEEPDEDEFVDIDLQRELAPRLWGAIIHDGLDGYAGTSKDFDAALRGKRNLRLTWPLDADDENKVWAVISADGVEIVRGEFEHFHDENRWNAAALRWLIQQLGIEDATLGKTVRKALRRKGNH